jgi:hypothetical protein
VVVDEVLAAVDVGEDADGFAGCLAGAGVSVFEGDVEDVGGREVEVGRIPGHLGGKVVNAETKVAKLVEIRICSLIIAEGTGEGKGGDTLWISAGPGSKR